MQIGSVFRQSKVSGCMDIKQGRRVRAHTDASLDSLVKTSKMRTNNDTHAAECRRAGIHDDFPEGFRGVYVISPDSSPVDQRGVWLFKVGRGQNVCRRIADYATYFPYGSWICFVAPVSSTTSSRTVEKDLVDYLNKTTGVVKLVPGVTRNEWFYAKWDVMLVACKKFFEERFDEYIRKELLSQGYGEPPVEPHKNPQVGIAAKSNVSNKDAQKYL